MASSRKVAIVTGSNKGIGFAIVRALCKKFEGDVILTSRDEGRGQAAVAELKKEGLDPKFHQLDIDNSASIEKLRDFIKEQYGGIDILVNNAGIAYKQDSKAPFGEQATVTVNTNFTSTLNCCLIMMPLLKPHSRVSNVSSFVSNMSIKKCSPELQARIKDPGLTLDGLKDLMAEFVSLAQKDEHQAKGWPNTAYGVSKIGCTRLSQILQKVIDSQGKEDIVVNACCPGYVSTDMTSHKGKKTIDKGAETPVFCALVPANAASPRGEFLSEMKVVPWG